MLELSLLFVDQLLQLGLLGAHVLSESVALPVQHRSQRIQFFTFPQ